MTHQIQFPLTRLLSPVAAALGFSLLSACTTTPSIVETKSDFDASIPAAWQNTAADQTALDTKSLSQWWTHLGDPQLEDLINDALTHNPDIRSALSAIRQARAERGLENSNLWPALTGNLSGSNTHNRDLENDTSTHTDNYTAGLDASWEIDLFAKQRQYLQAADAELAAATDDYHQAQVSLSAEVAETYLTLASLEAQLKIVQTSLTAREATLQIAQWQEESGESDALGTQQSIASVEQTRAQIPDLEQNILETRHSLSVLTGRTPQALETLLQAPINFPEVPPSIAVGIPADTLRQRPDVRSAESAIAAAQSRLTATERSRLPSLTLSGSIGIDALSSGELIDPRYLISNFTAAISAPLWNSGQIRRNIAVQAETVTQTYLSYESTVLNALTEVENALSAIQKQTQRLDILQKASKAARQSVELAQLQYEAGEIDLLDVLETQQTELSLEQTRIATQAEALGAHVQLYKSLGGGWNVPSTETQF